MSIYYNKLMTGFDDTRDFMDFMAGQRVPIWDIPVVMRLIRKTIDRQLPWLKRQTLDPEAKPDSYPKFIRSIVAALGEDHISFTPLKRGAYKPRDVMETL